MQTRLNTKKDDNCTPLYDLNQLGKLRVALNRSEILKGFEEIADPSEKAILAFLVHFVILFNGTLPPFSLSTRADNNSQ